ncbi:MAG: AAA family ATPase [Gemmatimonadetes bacterium]|nr:AAA family ATPase [Gemmatimonadota bacterium]
MSVAPAAGDDPFGEVLARLGLGAELVDPSRLPTGFPSLDHALGGGFHRGDLVVLGGDVSAGTSALALAMAVRAPGRALLLTGEHTPARVRVRALAAEARVPLAALEVGAVDEDAHARLTAAAARLRARLPVVVTLGAGGMAEVEAAVADHPEAALVLVDPLEALLTAPHHQEEALGYALLACKRLALARDTAVVVAAHLPRLDPARLDRRPRLEDLGARGAAGVHADVVLGLYRDELYADGDLGVAGGAELRLLKHRAGGAGYVDLYFSAATGRFEDLLDP